MDKVFISYSHDNKVHEQKVIDLAARLRELGVDIELDKYTPHPDEGWPTYMIKNVTNSRFTLCVCSQPYKDRFEQREPIGIGKGAKFEGKLITDIIYESEVNDKFIPILLDKEYGDTYIPIVLKSFTHYDISVSSEFSDLYARLTNQEQQVKPPLGNIVPIHELQKTLGVKNLSEETCDKVKKQCIARFRSNGLDEKTATALFDSILLSDQFNYLLPQDRRINYVIGDFGSGKSLALAVLYLQKVSLQENAMLVSAKDIPVEISLDKYLHVENIKEKTTIFIDGLDEISYNSGKKIIDGIILSETYCNSLHFVVSSRPSILVTNNCLNQLVNVQPLSFDESINLMQQVAGNTLPVGIILGWQEELKETLLNPFFAILAGLYFKETNQFLGLSKQAFIKYLVQKSIYPLGMDEIILTQLENLAVKYIQQEQNKILISDLPSSIKIQEVLKTGLIQLEDDYVYFNLPIVAQWLAAAAIKDNIIDSSNLFASQAEIIKWRYALMLFMGDSSFEDSKVYFKDVVVKYPGLASQILIDNTIREDINYLPSADICGSQISFCIHTWAEGLKKFAQAVIPYDGEKICTFKISVQGPWLYIWWMKKYLGQDYEVVTSPPNENEYYYSTGTRVGKTSIWPWIVTFNFLSNRMKNFIESKPLFSDFQDLKEEFLYDVARKVLHQGSLCREDLSLNELKKSIDRIQKTLSISILQSEISRLEKAGQPVLAYPHVKPDQTIASGWTWDRYSHDQTMDYIHSLYKKAVVVYQRLCDEVFSGLSNMMPYRLMLPATMYIHYHRSNGSYTSPTISWYFMCREQQQENEVVVTESDGANIHDDNTYKEILASITHYRATIASLCPVSISTGLLDIFNEMPLHKIIFRWLNEDLKAIGWI